MLKKTFYTISALSILLITYYIFQNIPNGAGFDKTIYYEKVINWPSLPKELYLGNPTGIGLDTNQNIIIFHRARTEWPLIGSIPDKLIPNKTILIIDKENGKLIDSWGENLFIMPHGLTVDNKNNIWVTDVGLNQVFKFSNKGKLLMKLGVAKKSGNDSLHFDKPTDIAVTKEGSFYVSDGYGNNRIIKFSSKGKYLFEWGKKGKDEGEFDIPHAISLDAFGNVYVADRENFRIQVFDENGNFLKQYVNHSFGTICSVFYNMENSKIFTVDDFTFMKILHRGSDIMVINTENEVQTRFGRSGSYSGKLSWYHDIVSDKNENIYVGDIKNNTIQKFKKVVMK